MRERPILFSGPMVRAILDGRKTQTRRVVKVPKHIKPDGLVSMTWEQHDATLREQGVPDDARPYLTGPRFKGAQLHGNLYGDVGYGVIECPYGQPGDRLWVRETSAHAHAAVFSKRDEHGPFVYAADGNDQRRTLTGNWRPSIHMPRSACRLVLEISCVRVERLQAITAADVEAEGWRSSTPAALVPGFAEFWDSLNASRGCGWDDNPWVWVIEFTAEVKP